MLNFQTQMDQYVREIEGALPTFLPRKDAYNKELNEAMAHSLLGGGKRIRGVMVLAFYEFFGGKYRDKVLPFAAALEMVHAYSLVHDDLPCMDDDAIRRGKPSCHVIYGEATALLAGDALLTLAFETLTRAENHKAFGADTVLAAIRILALSAGVGGMIGGQAMDLANESKDISAAELEATDSRKTGALFKAATLTGALLAGAVSEQMAVAETYAGKIGLAFQIKDDVLDQTSDNATLGKPVGSDINNSKNTYTSLYGISKANAMAEKLAHEAKSVLATTRRDALFLNSFTDMLSQRRY